MKDFLSQIATYVIGVLLLSGGYFLYKTTVERKIDEQVKHKLMERCADNANCRRVVEEHFFDCYWGLVHSGKMGTRQYRVVKVPVEVEHVLVKCLIDKGPEFQTQLESGQ